MPMVFFSGKSSTVPHRFCSSRAAQKHGIGGSASQRSGEAIVLQSGTFRPTAHVPQQGSLLAHRRASLRLAAAAVLCTAALLAAHPAAAQSAAGWAKRGADAEVREDYDAAFEAYRQAHLLKPKDLRYQTKFERIRFAAAAAHVDRGRVLRQSGDLNGALTEFQRALSIDGGNQTAQQEITITTREMSNAPGAAMQREAPLGPSSAVIGVAEPQILKTTSSDPITYHAVADVKEIYTAIGKTAGLNVIFDPDYTSRRLQFDVVNTSLSDALRILGIQSGTFYKTVTPNTIFVAANTLTKHTDFNSFAVQTFYLSNAATQADQNELLTALRNVLDPTAKIFLVPSQNAIVMRATPDQLLLTETLLNNMDRAKSEVVVDVAVLEVNRDKARNLGITLPQSISVTPQINSTTTTTSSGTTTSGTTTSSSSLPNINTFYNFTGDNLAVSIGSATVNALLNDSDTRILQNPRIRASDGQRAQLKVGQRIPIATGSYSSGASTAIVSSLVNTQFTYIDVGVTIDVTPTVHQDREITLKLKMEISSQNGSVTISSVTEPIIAQRTVEQTIQLKEGEPSILAGILTRQESKALTGTPGLSELPILKKIFGSTSTERIQDEVVFLLIPHIVREPLVTRMNTRAIDTGTSNSIELRRDPNAPETVAVDNSAYLTTGALQRQQTNGNVTARQAASAMIGMVGDESSRAAQAAQAAQAGQPYPGAAPGTATPGQPLSPAALGAPSSAALPVSFGIAPGNSTQAVGSTFQVAVSANNARDLYAAPLQVKFDPRLLSLVNVDAGEMLSRDGQSVSIVHRDEGNGLVTVSVSRPPGVRGVDGQGSVAVLTFKALAAGDSPLALSKVGATDSSRANLPAVGSQSIVHIK